MRQKLLTLCLLAAFFATSAQAAFDADSVYNSMWRQLSAPGPDGPYGPNDISNNYFYDGSQIDFYRSLWNIEELASDEFICSWGDNGLPEMNKGLIEPDNIYIYGFYARHAFTILTTNYYLENAPSSLTTRRAEARLLRAYLYMNLIDIFGDVPFTTSSKETTAYNTDINPYVLGADGLYAPSAKTPAKKSRAEIFNFIETELKACAEVLPDDHQAQQYRPDKVAAWLLLSRLYLNAGTYTGTPRWADAKIYAKKVMDSQYSLVSNYKYLFMGDNDSNGAQDELILPVYQDGTNMQSWQGMTFVIASMYDGNDTNGLNNSWSGNRLRENLVRKFFPNDVPYNASVSSMTSQAGDDRAMFCSTNATLNNTKMTSFHDGLTCEKFTNVYTTQAYGSNTTFADTDIPLLRLAEAYLTYAEADARLNGGSCSAEGVTAYNTIRSRAHASTFSTVTTDMILDEWAREFYGEARRHSDLVRFGRYSGSDYLWPWKGGIYSGTALGGYRNLLPLPTQIMLADETYTQNPGYFDINTVHINKPFSLQANDGKTGVVDLKTQDIITITPTGPTVEGISKDQLSYSISMVPLRYKGKILPVGLAMTAFDVFTSTGSGTAAVSTELVDSCLYLLARAESGISYITNPKTLDEKDTLLVFATVSYGGKALTSDTTQVIVQPYSPWQKDHETTYGSFTMNRPSYINSMVDLKNLISLTFSWKDNTSVISSQRAEYSLYMSADGFKDGDGDLIGTAEGETNSVTVSAKDISQLLCTALGYKVPSDIPQDGVSVSLRCTADNGYGVKSNSDTLTVKLLPYCVRKKIKSSYLIGSSIGDGGWDNNETAVGTSIMPMYAQEGESYDADGKGVLSWTGYLDSSLGQGMFQILEEPGNWGSRVQSFGYSYNGLSYYHSDYDAESFPIESSGLYTLTWNNAYESWPRLTIDSYTGTSTVYTGMNVTVNGQTNTAMTAVETAEGLENHDWYIDLTVDEDTTTALSFSAADGGKTWTATEYSYGVAGDKASTQFGLPAGSYKLFFNDVTGQYLFYSSGSIDNSVKPTDEYGTLDVDEVAEINLEDVTEDQEVQVCSIEPLAEGITATDYHILLGSDFSTNLPITDNGEISVLYLKDLVNSGAYQQNSKRRAPSVETGHVITSHHAIPAKIYATYNDGEKEYLRLSDQFTVNVLSSITVDLDSAYYYLGNATQWQRSTQYKLHSESDDNHVFTLKVEKGSDLLGWFVIIPQSQMSSENSDFWDNVLRPGNASLDEGSLIVGYGDSFYLPDVPDGYDGYMCTFDMDNMRYSFKLYNATGISSVSTDKTKTNDVYSIGGQLLRKNAASLNGLPSGAYIVNGKVVVKK